MYRLPATRTGRFASFGGLLSVVCLGCGGAATDTKNTGSGSEETPTEEELVGEVELLVPHSPVDESAFALTLVGNADSGLLVSDIPDEVRLAFGDEYSDTMRFHVSAQVLVIDGGMLFSHEVKLDAATPEGDGIEANLVEDDVLEVVVHEASEHRVMLEGAASFEEGGEFRAFSGELILDARQVGGAEWSPCGFDQYFVSGAPLGHWRVFALDEEGNSFEPRNATVGRPADVLVKARGDTTITATGGMETVVITGPSQRIHLFSNYGEMQSFELIQPGQIDSFDPLFYFDQGGARGGGTAIESGGSIALDLSLLPYISVHPRAYFQGTPLCGGPDPRDFVLRSTTPEVCVIQPNGCLERGCPTSEYVRDTVDVFAVGVCNLELEAPSFNGGEGLSTSYAVEIESL